LHKVDPSGEAVVGGLADSATGGVDVASDERLLAALTGPVDAVGYHPWVFDVSDSLLEPDTSALRSWMDGTRLSGVPLEVNEFGACENTSAATNNGRCPIAQSQTSATWGPVVANYTEWALCTPGLDVTNVLPFFWGATANTAQSVYLPLMSGDGALTTYGQDYLSVVKTLTTQGCPSAASSAPPPSPSSPPGGAPPTPGTGQPTSPSPGTSKLLSMDMRVVRVNVHGQRVSITVRYRAHSGQVTVAADRRGRRHGQHRLKSHRVNATTISWTGTLPVGQWKLIIAGKPAKGFAKPKNKQRNITVRQPKRRRR
jgi:hypothetical protein